MYAEGKMKAEGVAESIGNKCYGRRCRREMAKRAVDVKAATIRQACEALVCVMARSFRLGLNRLRIGCFLWRTTSEIGELGVFSLSAKAE